MVHLQTLSHFVQEVKGRGDDNLSPALISQDSLNGNAHQVFLPLPPQKPWPFLHLINQLVSMAHLFYKLLLTYHMLSIRHDAGPWGASHPMGKVWLRNKKCHKALQICIGWQMLEAHHPHIWKKYALQHLLNNVFPPKLCKSTQQSRSTGDDGVPVLPCELLSPSSLQLGESLFCCTYMAGKPVDHEAPSLHVSPLWMALPCLNLVLKKDQINQSERSGLRTWYDVVNWMYDFPLEGSWGRRRSPGWQGWEWMACRLLFPHSTSGLNERFVLLPRAENDGLVSLLEERML